MKVFITTKGKAFLKNVAVLLVYLAVWQLVYLAIQKEVYLPSPWQVLSRLGQLVREVSFWQAVAFSMYRVGWGILLSVLAGVLFGILAGWSRLCFDLLQPLVIAVKSTPVISFIIIALIWFPSSVTPVFICLLMCFPIIWTNTVTGIHSVDEKLLEMARVYRVGKAAVWRKIYLPTVLPYFTAGLVTALGLGWRASVAAEVLSHPRLAIGSQLYTAKIYLDSGSLFAWTLVVIILSLNLEKLFSFCLNRLNKRGLVHGKHPD